jgi:hypothetical protein
MTAAADAAAARAAVAATTDGIAENPVMVALQRSADAGDGLQAHAQPELGFMKA